MTSGKRLPIAMALILLLSAAPGGARADCSVNTAQICLAQYVSSDSIFYREHWCSQLGASSASVSWELAKGEIWLGAEGSGTAFAPGVAIARVTDVFQLAGSAPQAPVDFDARLQISLATGVAHQTCTPFQVNFGVVGQPDSLTYSLPSGCTTVEPKYLTLHLQRALGEPLELFVHAMFNTDSIDLGMVGSAALVIQFARIPAGAIVTSCHGYLSDIATSARAKSWGALKLIYR